MSDADEQAFEMLRRLVVERPREARSQIDELLDSRPSHLPGLLARIKAPSESRLRQVIANSIRVLATRREAVLDLSDWFATETDEFTKNALRAALAAGSPPTQAASKSARPVDPAYVEAYRYAASRLTHKVRNAVAEPQAAVLRLAKAIERVTTTDVRDELACVLVALREGLRGVGRVVEFDTEDRYFQLRAVQILSWLRSMNQSYAQAYSPIELVIDANSEAEAARVVASDYFLTTIFWNLWINAHQATESRCLMTVRASATRAGIQMLVLDNGSGFLAEARDSAFASRYSSKGKTRGRGLLEVQDAVEQLRGDISLVDHQDAVRVRLDLPLAQDV
jgi:signal transduction histidine kinase